MESEVANTVAIIGGYWQAVGVIVAVVVLAVGAFSLVSFWAGRHIDTKFDKHAALMEAHHKDHRKEMEAHYKEVEGAIARGTKEHDDWRVLMKAMNEKVTDLFIEREVERRMQASRGGARTAGSGGVQEGV